MLALDVRHPELGIATAPHQATSRTLAVGATLTAGLAVAATVLAATSDAPRRWRCGTYAANQAVMASPARMPPPSDEPVAIGETAVAAIACDHPSIQTIVFKGRVHSAVESTSLLLQFAELPAGYAVMTTPRGEFEIRVPRAELGVEDLCSLPTSGRNAAFKDAQLSIEYVIEFER